VIGRVPLTALRAFVSGVRGTVDIVLASVASGASVNTTTALLGCAGSRASEER
jgi:hypothetical protein